MAKQSASKNTAYSKYQNGMRQMGMHVGKVSKKTKTYSAPKTRQYDDDIPF